MRTTFLVLTAVVIAALITAGCSQSLDSPDPSAVNGDIELQQLMLRPFTMTDAIPPSPLVTVGFGADELTFWPFAGNDFSGQGQDPINLIFVGKADPLEIRAALLSLDGDRSSMGLPPMPPFNMPWDDDVTGDEQAGYGESVGWAGSCVQLTCGEYGPMRFHVRLFKMGEWTVANAHFELQVPGTSTHQVLSWELAEQLVVGDFIRSGLLDPDVPMAQTQQINPSPWRGIPGVVYNMLPPDLRYLIGGPMEDIDESDSVGIGTDGRATILNLAGQVPLTPEVRTKSFVIEFGQAIPKPFCESGPYDYVYIQGPVQFTQTTSLSSAGVYNATFRAEGELLVTPINPATGEPIGETLTAEVMENHNSHFGESTDWVSSLLSQHILPDTAAGAGRLFVRFQVRTDGQNGYLATLRCADNPYEDITAANKPAVMQGPAIAPSSTSNVDY